MALKRLPASVKILTILLTIAAPVIFLVGAQSYWFYTVEDAFISFRYCENMLSGDGLVFNPGTPVEGYTNFLWIMLIALPRLVLPFPLAAKAMGLFLGLILILSMACYRSEKHSNPLPGPLAAVVVALCPGIQMWSVAGLETILFTVCLTSVFLFGGTDSRTRRSMAGFLLGLTTLTRPEGLLFFGLFIVVKWFEHHQNRRQILDYFFGYFLIVLPHIVFRAGYYNALIPNTFWVKSHRFRDSGLLYFTKYAALTGFFTLPVALLNVAQTKRWKHSLSMVVMGTVYLFYVLYIGGDWMPYGRFLIPVLPLFALAASHVAFHWRSSLLKSLCIILILTAGAISSWSATYDSFRFRPTRYRQILTWETQHMESWIQVGKWLSHTFSPDQVLCTGLAGVIPYYSGLTTLDRGGLNDREIAKIVNGSESMDQEKREIDKLIMNRLPDIVMIEDRSFQMLTEMPIFKQKSPVESPDFDLEYELKNVRLKGGYFAYYQRKP